MVAFSLANIDLTLHCKLSAEARDRNPRISQQEVSLGLQALSLQTP